jgi:hypothetical protein
MRLIEINKFSFLFHKTLSFFPRILRKIIGLENFKTSFFNNKRVMKVDETNSFISSLIESNKPFLVSRYGDTELRAMLYAYEFQRNLRFGFPSYIKEKLYVNAGYFPINNKSISNFGSVFFEASSNVDLFGVWYNFMEDFFISQSSPNASFSFLENLEPYFSINPWSKALKGKKVLVVNPFKISIEKQYQIHEKLFKDENVLPKFDLKVYKSVQTNGINQTPFKSWFEALENMKKEILRLDFEIAILGCGSYGLPLGSFLKSQGKQVIHLGGSTQLLFGIKGKRWEAKSKHIKLFNEFWIRPSEEEKPNNFSKIESGCYW